MLNLYKHCIFDMTHHHIDSNDCRTTFKDPAQVSSLNCGQRPFVELADAQPIRDIPFNMMVL